MCTGTVRTDLSGQGACLRWPLPWRRRRRRVGVGVGHQKVNQPVRRVQGRGGRPPAFDREAYKQRDTVERSINSLKQWRGIASRSAKTASLCLAGLYVLYAAGIFLRSAGPRAQEQERTASSQARGLR